MKQHRTHLRELVRSALIEAGATLEQLATGTVSVRTAYEMHRTDPTGGPSKVWPVGVGVTAQFLTRTKKSPYRLIKFTI